MRRLAIVAICILSFSLSKNALAADALFRLMHNDQNVLALGEITELDETKCVVTTAEFIISEAVGFRRTLMEPEVMKFKTSDFYYWMIDDVPKVGDFVLVSADCVKQSEDKYKIGRGCYRVSELDREKLKIELPDAASEEVKANMACVEWFVRSGGADTEFGFSEESVAWVYPGGDRDKAIIIFPEQ